MTTTAATWDAQLPTLDMQTFRPVFDELAGHEVDAKREFGEDRKHVRRTDRAVLLDARRLANALEHIGRLPEPRESFHLVTKGAYSCWHIVKAVLSMAAPATIRYLGIATLGFSKANLEDLLGLLDSGQKRKPQVLRVDRAIRYHDDAALAQFHRGWIGSIFKEHRK